MKRVTRKCVSRILKEDQKQSRLNECRELKKLLLVDLELFSKVITGDDS